jgi:RES domain-containing protein
VVTAFRLATRRHPPNMASGAAGRWNQAGVPVIYTGASLALSALEILASRSVLADDYVSVRVDIADDVSISVFSEEDLPPDWWINPHPESSRAFGSNWAKSLASAVMSVPSSLVRSERNYILNPAHADFARIVFAEPVPFGFEERLRRGFS